MPEQNLIKEDKHLTAEKQKTALLVATYKGTANKIICDEHLDELELLAQTSGIETKAKQACPIKKIEAATFIGKGKLAELVEQAKELDVDLIIIDEEISPGQQRNLEKAFNLTVMDRTELILDVFGQRAQTKEARLQIELAKVKYQYPRLKRLWTHLSRQTGGGSGGVYLKGEGEKQIELDKRMLKDRIERLQDLIKEVKLHRHTQRTSRTRAEIPIFAIVGYTNAGKSTLLNALTDADVFVEDKLFATLDTTTRKYSLSNNQEILLIDTVGFIRKLPHLLVAAFKSTLEEALEADILIHLIDASHPMAEEQAEASYQVLKELNASDKPIITVLNKVDKARHSPMLTKLRLKYPKTVQISAISGEGFDELQEHMLQEIAKQRKVIKLRIPQSDYAKVSQIMRLGKILQQDYDENDVLLSADVPASIVHSLKNYVVEQ